MIECKKEAITKEIVDAWMNQWETFRQSIHQSHSARDGNAKEIMLKAIQLYESFVVSASVGHDVFQENEQYEILPINAVERLSFIKTRPGQYACYRQLDELFLETKKRCARLRLKL
ncbi:YpoC family protein [Rummeliibacillus pycnus]|uniref:YpoC family protein n=1 Tax=Rummeliibacillus pycnus TaxID=101070 RepID=UPI003D2C0126